MQISNSVLISFIADY